MSFKILTHPHSKELIEEFKKYTYNMHGSLVAMSNPSDDMDLLAEFERLVAAGEEESEKVINPKNGDHVIYSGQHKARVISPMKDGTIRIQFYDQSLIPPKMNVPPEYLEWELEDGTKKRYVNPHLACPGCDVPWKETKGFSKIYYDCPDCGAKKENHVG